MSLASQPTIRKGQGLRLRLEKVPGLTLGASRRILRTPYYFQCPPMDSFAIPTGRTHNRRTNYKGNEFSARGGIPLKSITFRTLVVEWGAFVIENNYDLDQLIGDLERLAQNGWPFRLLATHSYDREAELDLIAVLESVSREEVAGETDTRYLDLTFAEYDAAEVKRKGRGGKEWPKTVTVKKNGKAIYPKGMGRAPDTDITFARLARDAYGRPAIGKYIALAQKPPIRSFGMHTAIIKHPRFRKKGGKIVIPKPPPRHLPPNQNEGEGVAQ